MVRKYIFVLISLLMLSCFSTKNIYKKDRFKTSRFKIKPNFNNNLSNIIDTSSFYLKVKINNEDSIQGEYIKDKGQGLKFYKEGRVAFFDGVNLFNSKTLDPRKARMGYFEFEKEFFLIESILPGPHRAFYLSREELLLNESYGDTLVIKTYESPQGSEVIRKYLKETIPKEALIYKPDW